MSQPDTSLSRKRTAAGSSGFKITTSTKRYQGPASLYPFPSAEAAWLWIREQFGPDLTGGWLRDDPAGEDLAE
jgi:hypothetical protein